MSSKSLARERKTIRLTTDSVEALKYYEEGLLAQYQSYEKETLEGFKKAIECDPEFVMARALYAGLLAAPENQRMIDEAKKHFDKVTEGERLFTLAMEAQVNNDRAKQREILEELVTKYPDDGTIRNQLGALYYFDGLLDKAILEYRRAIACDPRIYSAYNSLGYLCLFVGKFDEGIKWLRKYAELLPESANPTDSLGDAYRHAGRYEEAWTCYQKAVAMKPDFTAALAHLGDVKHLLGFYDEAIPHYQDALKTLLPEKEISESHYRAADSFWRARLVNNYLCMGEVDRAEEETNTILQHDTDFGNVFGHYFSAEIALRRQDVQKAKEEADRVQKQVKESGFSERERDQIVHFIRAKIALAERDLASAERFALAAVNAFGEKGRASFLCSIYPLGNDRRICVEPLNLLARIQREQDRVEDEIQTIEKSLALIAHQPLLRFRLGQLYAQQGNQDAVVGEFKEYLRLAQEFNCPEDDIKCAEAFVAGKQR